MYRRARLCVCVVFVMPAMGALRAALCIRKGVENTDKETEQTRRTEVSNGCAEMNGVLRYPLTDVAYGFHRSDIVSRCMHSGSF